MAVEHGQAPETPMTDHELGPLLAAARKNAHLSQAQLGALLTDLPSGRRSFQTISYVERGTRQWPLSAWHAAVRALEHFDDAGPEVAALRSRLPPIGRPPAPATTWTTDDRRAHLRALLADLTASPPRRRFTRTAKPTTWSPYPAAEEILSRLDEGSTERPSPKDHWEIIESSSPEGTDIGKSEYFAIRVTLRNTGEVPWTGRLLSRLGVTVSTVMPVTPRVVSVPDTEPGGSCSVIITGRPAHLVGVTEIHFIMTFADLRPCFPDDRRTVRLTLATTTTIGAQETLPVPAALVRAARAVISQLRSTEDS
jgi:transcriptional regulator with XRE-family HTH domain